MRVCSPDLNGMHSSVDIGTTSAGSFVVDSTVEPSVGVVSCLKADHCAHVGGVFRMTLKCSSISVDQVKFGFPRRKEMEPYPDLVSEGMSE